MELQAELRLSFYREIATLNEKHGVMLVQHVESGKIYVRKTLSVYDLRVFQYLQSACVPGVVHIEEMIETKGRLIVIEEYVSGVSLREYLDEHGPLPLDLALSYLKQLCAILRPLHQLNPPVVHRDIKPSNILITPLNQLMLVDFNAAKTTSDQSARDTVLIGTFGYAAPEQYGFSASQPTADIYALGVLLNEMLTGKMPQQQKAEGPLAAVIQRCLQMDPARRYQNVDQLLGAVQGYSDGQSDKPEGTWRSWLLPGFRTSNPFRWTLAMLWYVLILLFSTRAVVSGVSAGQLTAYRIFYFVLLITQTLWFGNYRNGWRYFPLSRDPRRPVRLLGVACWSVVFFFLLLLCLTLFL